MNKPIMKYTLLFSALVKQCHCIDIEDVLPPSQWLNIFFAVAFVLVVCYTFYPAYTNVEGGLGCTVTILSGKDVKENNVNAISLVIPAYNEAERLPIMLDDTLAYLDANRTDLTRVYNAIIGGHTGGPSEHVKCEYVVVNDGSTDGTEHVVRKYATKMKNGDTLKLVNMHQNCGKGGAVKTGMLQSSGQLCLMVDADGATDISDGLPKVMKEMERILGSGKRGNSSNHMPPAAVFGSRAHLEDESCASRSKIRTFLMHAFHFFVKTLCSPRIKDTQCGFKLFTRSAAILLFTNLHLRRWAFDTEVVVIAEKLGVRLAEVGVVWHEIDGSKLDVDKLTLALVSLGMLRDMVCVRACYLLGVWKLKRAA